MTRPRNVLFLCTGNSARSIMAEAALTHLGGTRFRAFSAGSRPTGRVNPYAAAEIERRGLPVDGYRSKSWDEFAGGPPIDIVITVCGNADREPCPLFPGAAVRAHWGVQDPAAVEGPPSRAALAFAVAYDALEKRIAKLVALPDGVLGDPKRLKASLDAIGGPHVHGT
jgi:arsenate reductase